MVGTQSITPSVLDEKFKVRLGRNMASGYSINLKLGCAQKQKKEIANTITYTPPKTCLLKKLYSTAGAKAKYLTLC